MKNPIVFLVALVVMGSCFDDKKKETSEQAVEINFKKEGTLTLLNGTEVIKTLDIEIADDEYQRTRGLMDRSSMDENKGMLFLFEDSKVRRFWMKETRMYLDIIYIAENKKVINIAKDSKPYDLSGVEESKGPAKFVLEINGGKSEEWGIIEGKTRISWKQIK